MLRSDKGTQFVNQIFKELTEILGINHHTTMAYWPEANGLVERVNKEVMFHIKCLLFELDYYDRWSDCIPMAQHIVNNSTHSATGHYPTSMVYGINPFDSRSIINQLTEAVSEHDYSEYVQTLVQQLKLIQSRARIIQTRVLKKRDKLRPSEYPEIMVGDFVLLVNNQKHPGKMGSKLLGPFKVVGKDSNISFSIQSIIDAGNIKSGVHLGRLRKFNLPTEVSHDQLRKLASQDIQEHEVEKILAHSGSKKRKTLSFLVKWYGYNEDHNSWEPLIYVKDTVAYDNYIQENPYLV